MDLLLVSVWSILLVASKLILSFITFSIKRKKKKKEKKRKMIFEIYVIFSDSGNQLIVKNTYLVVYCFYYSVLNY